MNRPGLGVTALFVALMLSASLVLWMWWRLTVAQTQLVAAQTASAAAEVALMAYKIKAKAEQEAAVKVATRKEKWKQKAAGKGKRLAVAVPLAGAALAVWFEEREYLEWRAEHPELKTEIEARKAYYQEIYELCGQVLDDEFKDLKSASPERWAKVRKALDDWYRGASSSPPPAGKQVAA